MMGACLVLALAIDFSHDPRQKEYVSWHCLSRQIIMISVIADVTVCLQVVGGGATPRDCCIQTRLTAWP